MEKKTITISGTAENWYEKIIFVVKESKSKNSNIADDAEMIIDSLATRDLIEHKVQKQLLDSTKASITKNSNKSNKSNKQINDKIDNFLYSSIMISVITLSGLMFYNF